MTTANVPDAEFLKQLCLYGSNKAIANAMGLDVQQVKHRIKCLIKNTNSKNRTLLAVYAVRNALDK